MQIVPKQEPEPTWNKHIAWLEQLHKAIQQYPQKLPEEVRKKYLHKEQ